MIFPLPLPRRGIMLVLSSPSGAGKTSLTRALLAEDADTTLSVSVTTREPRTGEVHGTHYFFHERAEYDRQVAGGELLEFAEVFGRGYGTPRVFVEEQLSAGRDVLFDIDWQGTQQLSAALRADLVSVFILPPSLAELERRLRARAQDDDAVVAARMEQARQEISHWAEYDYVLVNQDFDETLASLRAILKAERSRRSRQPGLSPFVKGL